MAKNINKEIADLEAGINSPATPEAQKVVMRRILETLKSKAKAPVKKLVTKAPVKKVDSVKKAGTVVDGYYDNALKILNSHINNDGTLDFSEKEYGYLSDELSDVEVLFYGKAGDGTYSKELDEQLKKGEVEPMSKNDAVSILKHRLESIKDEVGEEEYNKVIGEKQTKPSAQKKSDDADDDYCAEIIKKEREAQAKRKANALKKASEPKKTPATKNKEAIIKASVRIEESIEKRLDEGKVSKSELQKLIDETEALLSKLKSFLPKIK